MRLGERKACKTVREASALTRSAVMQTEGRREYLWGLGMLVIAGRECVRLTTDDAAACILTEAVEPGRSVGFDLPAALQQAAKAKATERPCSADCASFAASHVIGVTAVSEASHPLRCAAKRRYPPTLVSDRPLTRQRIDQAGLRHTVRQKRKRRDPQCVTPYRRRTRQCIADRESCDSKQTMRCVPRKLTPCGADAGVPFDPG